MTINELVEASRLSQAGFARCFHIPIRTLENWLAGTRKPPEYVLWMIEQLMNLIEK